VLLKAAESDPTVRAAILVSVATGVRQGELLKLRWKEVDTDKGTLTLHDTKNKTARRVHVPKAAAEAHGALRKARCARRRWCRPCTRSSTRPESR
jgi:integrase